MKSNRSLESRIAAGSADADDHIVAYRTLSYLFDAFLVSCIYGILYYGYYTRKWDYSMHEIRTATQAILSVLALLLFEVLYSSLECIVEQPFPSKTRSI
jgi:hypothetical protein